MGRSGTERQRDSEREARPDVAKASLSIVPPGSASLIGMTPEQAVAANEGQTAKAGMPGPSGGIARPPAPTQFNVFGTGAAVQSGYYATVATTPLLHHQVGAQWPLD